MHKTLKLIFACNEQYSLGVLSFHMQMYTSGNLNATFYFSLNYLSKFNVDCSSSPGCDGCNFYGYFILFFFTFAMLTDRRV